MSLGAWHVGAGSPQRLERDRDFLEKDLERWIISDPSILHQGLRLVSQQMVLQDRSRLDLLGLTQDDAWLVVELKRGAIEPWTVTQALHYALLLGAMPRADFKSRVAGSELFKGLPDADQQHVLALIDAEAEEEVRRVNLLVGGTSRVGSLDVTLQSLGRLSADLAVTVVTVDVFQLATGERLVLRDVEEVEQRLASPAASGRSPEAIAERASQAGVREGFDALCSFALRQGLKVKPWPLSVTLTGAVQGNPTVLYLRPEGEHLVTWLSADDAGRFLGLSAEDLDGLEFPGLTRENQDLSNSQLLLLVEALDRAVAAAAVRAAGPISPDEI